MRLIFGFSMYLQINLITNHNEPLTINLQLSLPSNKTLLRASNHMIKAVCLQLYSQSFFDWMRELEIWNSEFGNRNLSPRKTQGVSKQSSRKVGGQFNIIGQE